MTDQVHEFRTETAPDGTLILHVPGTLDSVTAPNNKRDALAALRSSDGAVRVDLSMTTFMDSAGIGLLVSLFRFSKEASRGFVLAGAKNQPLSLIHTIQMDKVVDIEAD